MKPGLINNRIIRGSLGGVADVETATDCPDCMPSNMLKLGSIKITISSWTVTLGADVTTKTVPELSLTVPDDFRIDQNAPAVFPNSNPAKSTIDRPLNAQHYGKGYSGKWQHLAYDWEWPGQWTAIGASNYAYPYLSFGKRLPRAHNGNSLSDYPYGTKTASNGDILDRFQFDLGTFDTGAGTKQSRIIYAPQIYKDCDNGRLYMSIDYHAYFFADPLSDSGGATSYTLTSNPIGDTGSPPYFNVADRTGDTFTSQTFTDTINSGNSNTQTVSITLETV